MKRILLTSCLTVSSMITDAEAIEKHRLMWLSDPSSQATIGWFQEKGDMATVYYGTKDHGQNSKAYPMQQEVHRSVAVTGGKNHFVQLKGLKANTDYYYVVAHGDQVSRRLSFTTAPNQAQEFTFINGGDSRSNRKTRQELNKIVTKLKPLFVSFSGDMINRPTDEEWDTWFTDWQLTISEDGKMMPIIPHRGNHENKKGVMSQEFDTPEGTYFAFNIAGDTMRYYALNSEIPAMGKQGEWLENDLKKHSQSVRFLVAGYHKPMRPHVGAKKEGSNPYKWAQMFYDHGMDLAFESDSHCIKRTQPLKPSKDGEEGFVAAPNDPKATVYTGEGSWGAPTRNADDAKSWTLDCAKLSGFDWVHVGKDQMQLKTVLLGEKGADDVSAVSKSNDFNTPSGLKLWDAKGGAVLKIPVKK